MGVLELLQAGAQRRRAPKRPATYLDSLDDTDQGVQAAITTLLDHVIQKVESAESGSGPSRGARSNCSTAAAAAAAAVLVIDLTEAGAAEQQQLPAKRRKRISKTAKYEATRAFQPKWCEARPWLYEHEGRAGCHACSCAYGNHCTLEPKLATIISHSNTKVCVDAVVLWARTPHPAPQRPSCPHAAAPPCRALPVPQRHTTAVAAWEGAGMPRFKMMQPSFQEAQAAGQDVARERTHARREAQFRTVYWCLREQLAMTKYEKLKSLLQILRTPADFGKYWSDNSGACGGAGVLAVGVAGRARCRARSDGGSGRDTPARAAPLCTVHTFAGSAPRRLEDC